MKNIKLLIEYDGTNYSGWQYQKNSRTIEEDLRDAIKKATKEEVSLIGSGRTDKGVHALGQVANFYTNSDIPGDKYKKILDHLLADDITIVESEEVDLGFHARFNARGKSYMYRIYNRNIKSPIHRNYSYHVPNRLNVEKMNEASKFFIGEHDFTAFKVKRTEVHTGLRIIEDAYVERNGEFVDFYIKGKGFMHNMVRIMVGSLILVGLEKEPPGYIKQVIESKDRTRAGKTVAASGLYLLKVFY